MNHRQAFARVWIGLRLDRGVAWPTVASVVKEAYAATVARSSRKR